MKKLISILLFFLFFFYSIAFGATYNVGPGQTYEELGDVPWVTLVAGDTVLIHWRSTPYASKIFIRAQGTESQPVVIKGIPNSNGDLPVLSGENATTHPQFINYFDEVWTEDLGMFLIYRGPNDDYYTDTPSNIIFEYLELTGVKPQNTFTDQFGNIRNYNSFSSAIHALIVQGLTVRHCIIHDNAQGIFTNSYGGGMAQMSTNLLIEYNKIWDNGNADSDGTEHNIYAQSLGTIIQYNYIGNLRTGSVGATVKDRSSGTVIRYNWIESSGRTLDLVEAEDGYEITTAQPDYHDVYVYGNIFTNYISETEPFSSNMIHFGHDNSPEIAKTGILYFYNNTIYIEGDQEVWWKIRVFDLQTNNVVSEPTVSMYNNIIHKIGTTNLEMMRSGGTLIYNQNNWIQDGYVELGYGSTAQIIYNTPPITGTNPGFTNVETEDFTLTETSECLNLSGSFPIEILTNFPLNKQYVVHANVEDRPEIDGTFDLGAFEYGVLSANSPNTQPLKVFPNPTKHTLFISGLNSTENSYNLYNTLGQNIFKNKEFFNEIDISNLKKGIYLLEIHSNQTKNIFKIIKQ